MANTASCEEQVKEFLDRLGLLMRGIETGDFDFRDYDTHDFERTLECGLDEVNELIETWTSNEFSGQLPRDPHKEFRHRQHERL